MFLEPAHERVDGVKALVAIPEPVRRHRYILCPRLVPGHVGQQELAGVHLGGTQVVGNPVTTTLYCNKLAALSQHHLNL